MYTFLIIIHLFVSFIMIGAILLQAGKGAEIGAAFGGSSQTIFGSRGAATFLSKMTVAAAIVFMLTSLSLAFLSRERAGERSIMNGLPAAPSSASTVPAAPPTAQPSQLPQASVPAAPQAPAPAGATVTPGPPAVSTGVPANTPEKK
jgi:preprotein translocase subunit SecG